MKRLALTASCCGIDAHAHYVPPDFPTPGSSACPGGWPAMAPAPQCGHRHVMINDKVYRTVSDQCWDPVRRRADMAQMRVAHQVLSPMPELLAYWLPIQHARILLRDMNERLARVVQDDPDRFSGLGAVPLQDVDLAIEELHYIANVLRLSGVEIGSNVNGRPIGAPEFDPFFEAAARLGMAVFVHAVKPAGMDRLIGPPALEQALAFPGEIGLAAASAITTNLALRHPALRLAFSHGGGSLALLIPRLAQACTLFPALRDSVQESPLTQARRFFYDTLVYDASTLRHLIQQFGVDRLMLGTDYPFLIQESDPVGRIDALDLSRADTERLLFGNALAFLGAEPNILPPDR